MPRCSYSGREESCLCASPAAQATRMGSRGKCGGAVGPEDEDMATTMAPRQSAALQSGLLAAYPPCDDGV